MNLIRDLIEMAKAEQPQRTIGTFHTSTWFNRISPHGISKEDEKRADDDDGGFEVSEESRRLLLERMKECSAEDSPEEWFDKIIWVNLVLESVEYEDNDDFDNGFDDISDLYDGDEDTKNELRNKTGATADDDEKEEERIKDSRYYTMEFVIDGKVPDEFMNKLGDDIGGCLWGQYWDHAGGVDVSYEYCKVGQEQKTLSKLRREIHHTAGTAAIRF